MKWLEIEINTTKEGLGPLCDHLTAVCDDGFEVVDGEDFLAFQKEQSPAWDYIDDELSQNMRGRFAVRIYISEKERPNEYLLKLAEGLKELSLRRDDVDFGDLTPKTKNLEDEDFRESWKKYYKPIEILDNLVIVPRWEKYEGGAGKKVLILDPGLAFGTGSHATTRMSIKLIAGHMKKGDAVLDIGCGSGILSIAALLLGAGEAKGIDIDEIAVASARLNGGENGFTEPVFTVEKGNLADSQDKKYDLVVANIVADAIIALSKEAKSLLKEGGRFISSGIIDVRAHEVKEAIEASGFDIIEERNEEGWVAYCAIPV